MERQDVRGTIPANKLLTDVALEISTKLTKSKPQTTAKKNRDKQPYESSSLIEAYMKEKIRQTRKYTGIGEMKIKDEASAVEPKDFAKLT